MFWPTLNQKEVRVHRCLLMCWSIWNICALCAGMGLFSQLLGRYPKSRPLESVRESRAWQTLTKCIFNKTACWRTVHLSQFQHTWGGGGGGGGTPVRRLPKSHLEKTALISRQMSEHKRTSQQKRALVQWVLRSVVVCCQLGCCHWASCKQKCL